MNRIIFIMMATCLLGCSIDKPADTSDYAFEGIWSGISVALYSGADDEPATEEASIEFEFLNGGKYTFRSLGAMCTSARGSGDYRIDENRITLNQGSPDVYCNPFILVGEFESQFEGAELTLSQVLGEIFITTHEVSLEKVR